MEVENVRQPQIKDHRPAGLEAREEHRRKVHPARVEMRALLPAILQDWLPASQGRQCCPRREEPYDLAGFAHFSSCQGREWPLDHLDLFFNGFMQATRLNSFVDGVFFYFHGR